MNYRIPFSEQKKILLLGGVGVLALFVLSIIFYRERMLFLDNAFQTFLLIQEDQINVMAGRWPSTLIRVLPFTLTRLEWPLEMVMLSFSISYTLWMALHFYLTAFVFKQARLALVIPIVFLLPVSESFYWCVSELQQVIPLLITLFAAYLSDPKSRWSRILLIGLSPIILFYHPLSIVGFAFLWLYYYKLEKTPRWYIVWMVVLGLAFVLKALFLPNWYDTMKSNAFMGNLAKHWFNVANLPANFIFLKELWSRYYFLVILLIAAIALLAQKRLFRKMILVIAFTVGYILLVHLGDPKGDLPFYREANYLLLALFAGLPFTEYFPNKKLWLIALSVLMLISVIRISFSADISTNRIHWYENALSDQTPDRLILSEEEVPKDTLLMSWASPYESLLIDVLNEGNKSILITSKPDSFNDLKGNEFPGTFRSYSRLDPFYFGQ